MRMHIHCVARLYLQDCDLKSCSRIAATTAAAAKGTARGSPWGCDSRLETYFTGT